MIDPMIFEPFPVNVFIVTLRHTHTVYIKGVGTSMESATAIAGIEMFTYLKEACDDGWHYYWKERTEDLGKYWTLHKEGNPGKDDEYTNTTLSIYSIPVDKYALNMEEYLCL